MSQPQEGLERQAILRQALIEIKELRGRLQAIEQARTEPIAIVGAACRLPGAANTPEQFWDVLAQGRDTVSPLPRDRWDTDAFYDPDPDAPGKMYLKSGAFLEHVDLFEPQFFGISPREAATMDPQQRILLEVAWEALENAGQSPEKLVGSRTGVFVGIIGSEYPQLQMVQGADPTRMDAYAITGNVSSIAAGRLSFVMGLQGPCVALDTACSSSLVALHLACQSLRIGESDQAIVGGVNLSLSPVGNIGLCKLRALAFDGRCKSFDASADGYGRGEGCVALILKRLSRAQADGDHVMALVRGSAVNQDGPSSGLTVPNGPAQQAVIREALANAGIAPHLVGYLEAHGTGTPLGDPIEVQALGAVLGKGRSPAHPLAIGTVKANIAHLEAAAGVASLLKVVLCLQHKAIAPHPRLMELNPRLNLKIIPAVIPTELVPWTPIEGRRIAGVSSFGFSGTNAHIVLEEAPEPTPVIASVERPTHLMTLSARTAPALKALATQHAARLEQLSKEKHDRNLLPDVCFTMNAGRSHFPHRLALVTASMDDARAKLEAWSAGRAPAGVATGHVKGSSRPKVAFLFTGQGSQYFGMGRRLFETQPTFRRVLEQCDALLRSELERPLLVREVDLDEPLVPAALELEPDARPFDLAARAREDDPLRLLDGVAGPVHLLELRELLPEPEQTDLGAELRIVEGRFEMAHHRLFVIWIQVNHLRRAREQLFRSDRVVLVKRRLIRHEQHKTLAIASDTPGLLKECSGLLDSIQKSLDDYLETTRSAFPRFYYLTRTELLDVIARSRDPTSS